MGLLDPLKKITELIFVPGMETKLHLVIVAGVNSLSQSLSANPLTATTLVHLDLSGNILRGDDLSVCFLSLPAIFHETVASCLVSLKVGVKSQILQHFSQLVEQNEEKI